MPPMTEAALRENFFAATDYATIPGGRKKLEYLFSVLQRLKVTRPHVKVLDVGCGNGSIAFAVASVGCEVVGVDVNESSIERARKSNRFVNARFEVVLGDEFDLNDCYDLIICSEVLEHLYRPGRLLKTMVRHLKDEGFLFITVPNGYGPREVLGRTEKFLRERLKLGKLIDGARSKVKMMDAATKCAVHTSNPDQDHVQKFTMGELTAHLKRVGLSVVERVNSIFILSVMLRTKHGGVDDLDGRLADYLPHFMASGWYLLCQKRAHGA